MHQLTQLLWHPQQHAAATQTHKMYSKTQADHTPLRISTELNQDMNAVARGVT